MNILRSWFITSISTHKSTAWSMIFENIPIRRSVHSVATNQRGLRAMRCWRGLMASAGFEMAHQSSVDEKRIVELIGEDD